MHSPDTLPTMTSPPAMWQTASAPADPMGSLHIPSHLTSLHINSLHQRQQQADIHDRLTNIDDHNNSSSSSTNSSERVIVKLKQEVDESDEEY